MAISARFTMLAIKRRFSSITGCLPSTNAQEMRLAEYQVVIDTAVGESFEAESIRRRCAGCGRGNAEATIA